MWLLVTILGLAALAFLLTYAIGLVWWLVLILSILFLLAALYHAYLNAVNSGPNTAPDIVFWGIIVCSWFGIFLFGQLPLVRTSFDSVQLWTMKHAEKLTDEGFSFESSSEEALNLEEEIPEKKGIFWDDDVITFPKPPRGLSWGIQIGEKSFIVKGSRYIVSEDLQEVQIYYVDTVRKASSRARTLKK